MMKKKFFGLLIAVLLSTIVFSGCFEETKKTTTSVTLKTIYVDDSGGKDYTTIQAAIDNATDGDTIYVWAGSYDVGFIYRHILVNKSLTILGNSSKDTFIIGAFEVVKITANWTNISGFTIISYTPYLSGIHGNCGIQIIGAHNCRIENNKISSSSYLNLSSYGILLSGSNNNTIVNNTISNNLGPGIFSYSCENNKIYNNNFINNSPNAEDYGNNIWYNGDYGNYWSDYNGTDADSDGIGDTPYNISGGDNQDLYPLIDLVDTSQSDNSLLELRIDTDKISYNIGEVINISLTVLNPYSGDFQLKMTGNSTYEILIYNANDQLVYGENYWDVWGEFTIPANSEKTVVKNYEWNQTSIIDNEQVQSGVFKIVGKIFDRDYRVTSELENELLITIS